MPKQIPDLKFAFNLPPEKAIKYFESKGYAFSWDWHDVQAQAHAKAFTVAKVMRMDILQDIRNSFQKSLDEGITEREFIKNLEPTLKSKGWWGRVMVGDAQGGKEVQLGSVYRLKNIYRTNMQSAYMAGRYQEFMDNVDDRPYFQWVAVMDAKTRPAHAALNGQIFRHDDPFWNEFGWPPVDYACRCRTRALSNKNLADRNLKVSSSEGKLSTEEVVINESTGKTGKVGVYTTHDPMTGKKIEVKTGVGFNFNQGKEAWQPDLNKYDYDIAKQYIQGAITGPDFQRFFEGKQEGTYPVAVLNAEYRKIIRAETQVVNLSSETLEKNIRKHPEIGISEYQKLPELIENAEMIIEKQGFKEIIIKRDGKIYFSVIKTTQKKDELYLMSFRKTNIEDIKKEIKKGGGKIIINKLF